MGIEDDSAFLEEQVHSRNLGLSITGMIACAAVGSIAFMLPHFVAPWVGFLFVGGAAGCGVKAKIEADEISKLKAAPSLGLPHQNAPVPGPTITTILNTPSTAVGHTPDTLSHARDLKAGVAPQGSDMSHAIDAAAEKLTATNEGIDQITATPVKGKGAPQR